MTTPPRVLLMVENVSLARDHRLRKHASALVEAGMAVTVICRRDPRNATVPGVRVLEYPAPTDATTKLAFAWEYGYSLVMAALLTGRALLGGVDVVQVSSTPDIYFLLSVPLRLLGYRVIFDFKDLSPEIYEARYGQADSVMGRVLRRLERASLRAADHVVAVNASVREIANRRGGVSHADITIVGNGPRLAQMISQDPQPELRRGRRHLAVLVGMMGPQDGIELSILAIEHLVHTIGRTDCAFTFVGVGDAVADAARLVATYALEPWVSFPGWAEQSAVFAYLSTADIGLEPNLEPFVTPVKAMEYMAFGLPFVAFDIAETRVMAGGSAALVPPGDTDAFARAIDTLLTDSDRRDELGRTGRLAVETALAWDHQQGPYVDLVKTLAGGRRRERPRTRSVSKHRTVKGERA